MAVLTYLVLVLGAAVASPAAAYQPSSQGRQALGSEPVPQLLIHFPKTTEIGCFDGEQPPAGGRGVFFQLDRLVGHGHTCQFITYNMGDYRGNTDAYRFRRLVSMYPDIVRPDRKLECDSKDGDTEELEGSDFEMLREGERKVCRMVADVGARSNVPQLQLLEGYKRLPGGLVLLRAWYDLPAVSRAGARGRARTRYTRSPQPSGAQGAARRHDSAVAGAARLYAAIQRRRQNGGRG